MYIPGTEQTPRAIKIAVQLLVLAGVGLLLGGLSARFSPVVVLAVVAGIGIALVVLRRAELGVLLILVATSTVLAADNMPRVPIPVGQLLLSDVILLVLLGLAIVHPLLSRRSEATGTPLDLPFLLFFGMATLSTFLAIQRGAVDYLTALTKMRAFTYYLTFFIITRLVLQERQIKLLIRGFLLLAGLVSVAMIAQFALGTSIGLLAGRVEALRTEGTTYAGITRILPPGQSLVLVGFVTMTFRMLLARPTPGALGRLLWWGLLAAALILTFNRSFWVVTTITLVMGVLLARGQDRRKATLWILGLGFLLAVVLLLVFYDPESEAARLASATLDRLTTLVSRETFADPFRSSLRWRDFEYKYAIPQILARPITGIGLGTFYRPYLYGIDWVGFDGRSYTHNGHLSILMTTGLVGYLSFLWLSLAFLKRGFQYWHQVADPLLRATVLAFTLTYLGLFFISVVSSIFMDWFWMPVIGLMMGVNEVIIRKQVLQPDHPGGQGIGR